MPDPHDSGVRAVTACTIVAQNYLPAARVLASSYLEHHPDHRFVIAVIDAAGEEAADAAGGLADSRCLLLDRTAFGIPEEDYLRMATGYTVTELATSVKPYVLRELRRAGADVVIYLDPDIRVFRPMPELAELATAHQLVLTPHFVTPLPRDGKEPDEAVIMATGIFNLGFIATGPGAEPFLDFWAERLRHDAIVDPERQLFTDQRWVDQVPALYPHHVLRDPGFNAAYWNLHERELERTAGGELRLGGEPLRFFHFSGYRPETPWLLSHDCRYKPRILLSERPVLRELCDAYGDALRAEGYAESVDAVPYGFATFANGEQLTASARRLFRDAWVLAERKGGTVPPHAFGPDGGQALREWLTSPDDQAQAAAGLHRLAMAVWRSRVDLQLAFPHPCGADAAEFRQWCHRSGVAEKQLPDWAMPVEPAERENPDDEFGINMAGYLTAELGLGEMGRIVYDAITLAGIDVVSVVEERSVNTRTAIEHAGTLGSPRYPVSLLAINADQTALILSNHPELAHNRYTIGFWAWELEDFPSWQHSAFALVDEVWTVSDFCRRSIAAHSPVPVKAIPVPVRDPGEPAPRTRTPGEPVRFLFAFDFNSTGGRKNPWGVITAFQQAFGGRTDVRLTLKAINGKYHARNAERLRMLAAADERIDLIERHLSVAELDELYRRSDCYVSLHRSEGFGLTVAEAMARGLPVISTDYSSTTEFLDASTGWPIPYRMVPVGEGNVPYHADAVWADPDLDAAAEAMREVADDPDEAARRGRAAREHILRTRPLSATADWMRTELTRAYRTWQRRQAPHDVAPAPAPVDPVQPLRDSRQALRWRADTTAPSRLPLAAPLRKGVLRVIDHYDVHQRGVLGAVVDGVEETSARLLARIETLEARLADQRRDTAEIVRQQLDEALRPLREQAGQAVDRVGALRGTVGELQGSVHRLQRQTPETERALQDIRDDLAAVRVAVAAAADGDRTEALATQLGVVERRTHQMFTERDARADTERALLAQIDREVVALGEAVRLLHAPVPAGADVVLCDAGAVLLPVDEVVWPWLKLHRWWERSEAQLMAELMRQRPGGFVDVGAHVGYHTLRLMQSCPEVTAAVAVEVDPGNFACLERNLAVNLPADVASKVRALRVAAWDSDGVLELVHPAEDNSGDNRVRAAEVAGTGSTVDAVRLDGVPEVAGREITLVKLDLQGRDQRAIAGLAEVIRRDQPHIVCEFSPADIGELGDDPAQVLIEYRKLGYRPVVVGDDGPEDGDAADDDLIRRARASHTGFLTLWLRPG